MHKFLKLWFGLSSCSWDLELFYFKPVLYEFTYTNDVYNIYFYTILINYYKFLLQFKTCSCLWVGVKTRKFNISNSNKEGGIYDTVQVDCVSFSHEGVMISEKICDSLLGWFFSCYNEKDFYMVHILLFIQRLDGIPQRIRTSGQKLGEPRTFRTLFGN